MACKEMMNQDAINLINNEIACIQSTKCKREECASCGLVMPENDIIEALSMAIYALEKTNANDNRPRTNADYLRSLDDDKLTDWLCNQFWEDYKSDDVINIIRYNQVRNFLKMEYKNDI